MLKTKKLLTVPGIFVLLVLGTAGVLWALCPATYNRPNPSMDYVPQEIGIFDTVYWEHTEHNCRACHGNSTADRHHYTELVLKDRQCVVCHPPCTLGDPDCPNGITIKRDCRASECHADIDNGWHHTTDMAAAENCIACHDPNLIEEITPFRDHEMYPPSVVTPTPFSCENCHWDQALSPDPPEHPSTEDHYDAWGNFIGDYVYPKPIYSNFDTHHMQFQGYVVGQCAKCHSQDPGNPDWNPYNPELMRYCEICHSIRTLHIIGPHVSATPGWEAVGFHVPGDPGYSSCDDVDPTVYKTFTADEQCLACHADNLPPWDPEIPPYEPAIDLGVLGIQPIHGSPGAIVTLRGEYFGEEQTSERGVQLKLKPGGPAWIDVPIHSWTDTMIEWELPAWTFAPGNYWVRVKTEVGNSNNRVFTVEDHPTLLNASPDSGPCSTWITLSGSGGFGNVQSKMYADGYHGVHHIVDFVCGAETYTAKNYQNWSDTSLDVRIWNTFKDGVDTCGEPVDGRNFVQDDATPVPSGPCAGHVCPDEPTVYKCDCMALGTYSVYVKAIYFGDDDVSGDLTCGDIIFQVEKSDPVYFELTNKPAIYKLDPWKIERDKRLKIYGLNFGPYQEDGEVRIGTLNQYNDNPSTKGKVLSVVRSWSNTLIKVKVKVPLTWEGKKKWVWVVKNGEASLLSYPRPLKILVPLP